METVGVRNSSLYVLGSSQTFRTYVANLAEDSLLAVDAQGFQHMGEHVRYMSAIPCSGADGAYEEYVSFDSGDSEASVGRRHH